MIRSMTSDRRARAPRWITVTAVLLACSTGASASRAQAPPEEGAQTAARTLLKDGNALIKQGLRKEDFVGAEIIIKGFLAKDGTPTVNASSFTLVDSKKEFVNDDKTP